MDWVEPMGVSMKQEFGDVTNYPFRAMSWRYGQNMQIRRYYFLMPYKKTMPL
jgi:hypothetical protein